MVCWSASQGCSVKLVCIQEMPADVAWREQGRVALSIRYWGSGELIPLVDKLITTASRNPNEIFKSALHKKNMLANY